MVVYVVNTTLQRRIQGSPGVTRRPDGISCFPSAWSSSRPL